MISPNMPDEDLRALFTRKPAPVPNTSDLDVLFGGQAAPVQTEDELDADLEKLIAEIDAAPLAPKPEPSLLMQAVSGFFQGLIWHIEDQTPLDTLSDDQQDIIARVRSIVERDDPSLATKDAE